MIGKNIQNLRKDYRLTQVKFAKSIGISVRSLHRFENEVRLPPINVIKNIVDTYNVSISSLYAHEEVVVNLGKELFKFQQSKIKP